MEQGILFSETYQNPEEKSVKSFCFGDVMDDTLWEIDDMPDITHAQALQLDRIGAKILKKF